MRRGWWCAKSEFGRVRDDHAGGAPPRGGEGWNRPRRPTVKTRMRKTVGRRGTSRDPWRQPPRLGRRPAPRARMPGARARTPARLDRACRTPSRGTTNCVLTTAAKVESGVARQDRSPTSRSCSETFRTRCRYRRASSTPWSATSPRCSTRYSSKQMVERGGTRSGSLCCPAPARATRTRGH